MTKDEIIRMAHESKVFIPRGSQEEVAIQELERFAALVAAAEREACVKACKAQRQLLGENEAKIGSLGIAMCVDAIRARSKK